VMTSATVTESATAGSAAAPSAATFDDKRGQGELDDVDYGMHRSCTSC
jgi:hypothetical protein